MEIEEAVERWVYPKSFPQFDGLGAIASIIGSTSDISVQKHAHHLQIKRVEEYKELKRQQDVSLDNFI